MDGVDRVFEVHLRRRLDRRLGTRASRPGQRVAVWMSQVGWLCVFYWVCLILSMCLMTPINVSDIQVGVCNVVFWVWFRRTFRADSERFRCFSASPVVFFKGHGNKEITGYHGSGELGRQ